MTDWSNWVAWIVPLIAGAAAGWAFASGWYYRKRSKALYRALFSRVIEPPKVENGQLLCPHCRRPVALHLQINLEDPGIVEARLDARIAALHSNGKATD